jgi:cysteine-rich repeat protein
MGCGQILGFYEDYQPSAADEADVPPGACGDGAAAQNEECDDGNTVHGDGCDAACAEEDGWSCVGRPSVCGTICGDGIAAGTEACDDGNDDTSDACLNTCVLASCGDGFVQRDVETCDDEGTSDADACSSICQEQKVIAVSAGGRHACALLSGGKVKCWGSNHYGQLGLGSTSDRGDQPDEMGHHLPPVNLDAGEVAIAIAAGSGHTCALLSEGVVKCWGYNSDGQLGLGGTDNRGDQPDEMGQNLPVVNLDASEMVVAIATGYYHMCVLTGGAVKCWGDNSNGQLGLGDTISRGDNAGEMGTDLPAVDLAEPATAIAAGSAHTCALLTGGSVKCWGSNWIGQLGLGDTISRGDGAGEMGTTLPAIDLGGPAVAIAAGLFHTCALLTGGSVKCWGSNWIGQLGLGDTHRRGEASGEMGSNLPGVDLGSGKSALGVVAGWYQTCALLSDSDVKCWGDNQLGQLGLGNTMTYGASPETMGDNLPSVKLFSDVW